MNNQQPTTHNTMLPLHGMTDAEIAQKLLYTVAVAMRHAHEEAVLKHEAFGLPENETTVKLLDATKLESLSFYLGVPVGDLTLSLARQANSIVRNFHHSEWCDRLKLLAHNMQLDYNDFRSK